MPAIDRSRSLLAASAGYAAGDWASVGAEAQLDLLATASLHRGVDIGVGVEALARLDGSIRQFIAADVSGQASASARVRAQVQMPLDLFGEAGLAVRLQAAAEAAVGVELNIGLSVGDFLDLAAGDPRLKGTPTELLKVFLDELTVQGGVMAKAAASAMAYANLVATGTLVPRAGHKPGFIVAAEAGVGLKLGAGFRVQARFGVDDPRRLVRRSIDVAVDGLLASLAPRLPADKRFLSVEAAAPLKIGLRCAFELGSALAENGGGFSGGDGGKLATRLVQVGLEELQRLVLEQTVAFASAQLRTALMMIGADDRAWTASQGRRRALSDLLRDAPAEPFESTAANRVYWSRVVTGVLGLATELSGAAAPSAALAEPLSLVWVAAQLLMKTVERVSVGQARASILGASVRAATPAFQGPLEAPPAAILAFINRALGRSAQTALQQADAVAYLLKTIGNRLDDISPEIAALVPLLTGKAMAAPAEALSVVFSNIGAFAPDASGQINAEASLRVMRDGLRVYVNQRITTELLPAVRAATADAPELAIYLDEVLIATLRTVNDTVFDAVLGWSRGDARSQVVVRELCSSLLMRLFGSSLVVLADVLMAHAMGQLQGQLRTLARQANAPGGIAQTLSTLTRLDRALLADLIEETLSLCADVFTPMAPGRRAHIRDLLYRMIDPLPPYVDAAGMSSLRQTDMVGDRDAALELAQLLGGEIAGNLIRFVQGLLTRAAAAALALLQDVIADIQAAVDAWIADLQALTLQLANHLSALGQEMAALEQNLDDAADRALSAASGLLSGFSSRAGREAMRAGIREAVVDLAMDRVAGLPGYGALPREARREVRRLVRSAADAVLNEDLFDLVTRALAHLAAEAADVLDDLRALEPGDEVVVAAADIVLDRLEDGLRAAFGGDGRIRLRFDAPIIGRVDLGALPVPIDQIVGIARGAARGLGVFDIGLSALGAAFDKLVEAEQALAAAAYELSGVKASQAETQARLAESRVSGHDLTIAEPRPGAALTGTVRVRLHIAGATPALLDAGGLAHRRLFVWINGQSLAVTAAAIAPPATQPRRPRSNGVQGVGAVARNASIGIATVGTNLVRANAALASATLAKATLANPTLGPGLWLSIDVPSAALHTGVNTAVCVLAPGPAARRIERAVSFLHTTAAKTPAAGVVMPPRLGVAIAPDSLTTLLARRGVNADLAVAVAVLAEPKPLKVGWAPPRTTLKSTADASRLSLSKTLDAAKAERGEIRAALAKGALRPRSVATRGRRIAP